jgi:hypothetical protein
MAFSYGSYVGLIIKPLLGVDSPQYFCSSRRGWVSLQLHPNILINLQLIHLNINLCNKQITNLYVYEGVDAIYT